MTDRSLACVILAAGKGTRMKSRLAKVLHPVAGMPMLGHLLRIAAPLGPERVIVVAAPDSADVAAYAAPHTIAIQAQQRGTADAVKAARAALAGFGGDVLVLSGDMPLIRSESLARLIEARRAAENPTVVVLGMRPENPGPYGRLVMGPNGLERIVEALDASAEEKKIGLVNSALMCFDGAVLFDLLYRIGNDNAKGEFYLTDIVSEARTTGRLCSVVEAAAEEAFGVNSRGELAVAEAVMQSRLREAAMAAGATLIDPATVYFSMDTKLGRDVVVGPNVVFGLGVSVEDDVEIKSFCHIEGATIASGATIGPFARLRPGTVVGRNAHIGNFVEIKNATLAEGVKAGHLSYLGDATIGAETNIGAGTITCNYDGFAKHRTTIGAGAFIGSHTALVAPVTVGDGAMTGAGSTITQNVPPDALGVGRARQRMVDGWARKFRDAKKDVKS